MKTIPIAVALLLALSCGLVLGQDMITACVDYRSGAVYNTAIGSLPSETCKPRDTAISWNITGPTGLKGDPGPQGPPGPPGVVTLESLEGQPCQIPLASGSISGTLDVTVGAFGDVTIRCNPPSLVVLVKFVGTINWVDPDACPECNGIREGDPFTATLTYYAGQTDDSAAPNLGEYDDYSFAITVQSIDGPVEYGIVSNRTIRVFNDWSNSETGRIEDTVNNAACFVSFILAADSSVGVLTSDKLAEVNWFKLYQSSQVKEIFLRASNAAVIVRGRIDEVDVRRAP